MFMGFQGMNFGDDTEILKPFIEKLEKGELTLEDILEEDEIIRDIKSNNESQFINFFTSEKIKKLIDYSTKIPSKDEHNIGYKYPFNATEILCSECPSFQTLLMTEKILNGGGNSKKVNKNGFIFQLFKKINSVKNEIIKEESKDHQNDDETKEKEEEEEDSDFDSDEEEEIEDKNTRDENDKNQIIIYENVDYLLEFLKSDEANENYVLAGYFHRILSNLRKTHQMKIVKYLLDYPKKSEFDILCLLIKHMNRKSTCNIIQKLLMFTDDLISKYDENKMNLVSKIFDELDNSNDSYKNECICECISCVMNNRQFFDVFMTKNELLEKIYTILFNCKESNKYNSIIKLLTKLNENITQNFSVNYTTTNNNENNNEMKGGEASLSCPDDNSEVLKKYLLTLFEVLEKSKFKFFENFGNDKDSVGEFMSTYLEKQKKIGEKRILQIEYIKTVIDILVNANAAKYHDNKLEAIVNAANEQNIFWNSHELFFDFPFSNIYQIYYSQIMNIICNENSPKCLVEAALNENVGEKRNLIQFYIDKLLSNMKFSFNLTKTESFNPCFSYTITILNKIFSSQNSHIAEIVKNNKDLSVFYEVIGKEVENVFNQKLLLSDNFGGFGDIEEAPLQTFGPLSFLKMLEENCKIYEMYKNGENYEKVLEEKKERIEKEKEIKRKESINLEKRGLQYIDDIDEEEDPFDPFFKVEKVKKQNEDKEDKDNFLSILNKQPPSFEVKKEDNMKTIDNDDDEEDKDNFLSILNKPKEDVNKDKESNDNHKINENDKDYFKELYGEVYPEELNEDNNNIENSDEKKENE